MERFLCHGGWRIVEAAQRVMTEAKELGMLLSHGIDVLWDQPRQEAQRTKAQPAVLYQVDTTSTDLMTYK